MRVPLARPRLPGRSPARTAAAAVLLTAVAAGAGWAAGTQIESPATAAARAQPPAPSAITAPVERRVLTSDVVMRGDVTSDASVALAVTPAGEGRAVVTTAPPEVGSELVEGQVAAAVAGRPVLVLRGDLPVYRDLVPGATGDDVRQLEEALLRLGLDPGEVDGAFDRAAQDAVRELYARAGFEPAESGEEQRAELAAAREGVAAARREVAAAEAAMAEARTGPPRSQRLQLDAAVDEAVALLDAARAAQPPDPVEVQRAESAVAVAQALREEGLAPRSTAAEEGALAAARQAQEDAQDAADELAARTGLVVPAAELVFAPSLPARVDVVHVQRGEVLTGELLTVSGGALQVRAGADPADRPSLRVGQAVVLEDQASGLRLGGRIASVGETEGEGAGDDQAGAGGGGDDGGGDLGDGAGGAGGAGGDVPVVITPDPLPAGTTEDQVRGLNLRVTVAVTSTQGEVLAVPAAAVTAGTGGRSRVEREVDGGRTEVVEVRTGLSAAGFVEVEPVDGQLAEGDLVVVGR